MNREKIKGYLGICQKAGYLIIGGDNLKGYDKKMYLVLADSNVSNTMQKILTHFENGSVETALLENLSELVCIENCKIVGVKNKAIALEILKSIKGE